jgi:hypothetical protein
MPAGEYMVRSRLVVIGILVGTYSGTAIGQSPISTPFPSSHGVDGIKVTPDRAQVVIGETLELRAKVLLSGEGTGKVKWTATAPPGWMGSAGSIHDLGDSMKGSAGKPLAGTMVVYDSPYPGPAAVTLTATSLDDSNVNATVLITLVSPKPTDGPELTVDGSKTHPIDPLIYGMNDFAQDGSLAGLTGLTVSRWGGDSATPYNYKLDVTNAGADWFFETSPNRNTKYPEVSEVNSLVERNMKGHIVSIVTVPLIGWTTLRKKACSFPVAKFGPQEKVDPYGKECGDGVKPDGKTQITGNDPHDTSMEVDESWTRDWVKFLTAKFGDAAHGGVQIYELDNEPEYWAGVHKDIHPKDMTYDEITQKGLTYAKAIKDSDPKAEVMGPVISNWTDFFYSWKDMQNGWHTGPCYCPTGAPVDRLAHGDVPLMEYYLRAFKKYQDEHGTRLLDYLDLHAYFAAKGSEFHPAGDTMLQEARLDSTRAFWDPTYLGADSPDPETRVKGAKMVAPQIIPLMRRWIANDYPGTKTAITEYAYGGQEHINGAITQADVLGIFGREGLDLATLWGPPDPKKDEMPAIMAFAIYRNYDGKGAKFGETGLGATSGDQGKLAVYAAKRKSDGAVTVLVLNKTYGELKSSVALTNASAGKSAKVYRYSGANLQKIVPVPDAVVVAGKIDAVFPAQSITLFVVRGQ